MNGREIVVHFVAGAVGALIGLPLVIWAISWVLWAAKHLLPWPEGL